jgi:dynein-related subfamily AAA family protein/CbbQ/NirQ/NorQ-like protein
MTDKKEKMIAILKEWKNPTISLDELTKLCGQHSMNVPQWFTKDPANRVSRGVYSIPSAYRNLNRVQPYTPPTPEPVQEEQVETVVENVVRPIQAAPRIQSLVTDLESSNLVPKVYGNYVPFGNFDDLKSIIESQEFYPVFITGHSGNGKSMMIEQICAQLKRKFVCVSMTPETDESDLLGNFVLLDNQMVWRDGPVTTAARTGAVLLIDEIDYGAQNLSCLQRVLEGKPFLLKKKNEVIHPFAGFTVIATANTKGKGSEDGRYMFTNILNEAFLERFPITLEQEWAPESVERKIVKKELTSAGRTDDTFAGYLVAWATAIRRTFEEQGCNEVISTRRLVHITKAYGIFGDRMKSIGFCLNRFDRETSVAFLDMYSKIDESVTPPTMSVDPTVPAPDADPDSTTV